MDFGTAWARAARSLVLHVPSAILPEEGNAVLNPLHPEFAAVRMSVLREFHYDVRLSAPRTGRSPGRSR
jgi:RES domain-containing protein